MRYVPVERQCIHRVLVLVLAVCFYIATLASPALAHHTDEIPDLVERVTGGVVDIVTVSPAKKSEKSGDEKPLPKLPEGTPFKEFFEDFRKKQQKKEGNTDSKTTKGRGSGFIIDKSGIIVTANSVVEGTTGITVFLADGSKLPATILGKDKRTDLALLKVSPQKPIKAMKFGDSSKVRVGQTIVVIGNPFGLGGSVTSGIVSALNRDINAGPYDRFIQTDAAINRGNAGGPLFNLKGEVIGINTAIISPSSGSVGVAFAVPSNAAKGVISQLKDLGETRRGWLGVRIQSVTDDIASSLGMKKASGALIAGVSPGSPAEDGGAKSGDVILKFDGKEIESMRSLPRIVAGTEIGKPVDVQVLRKGKVRTLKITIARLPENLGTKQSGARTDVMPSTAALLGLTLEPLTDQTRAKYGIAKKVSGVVITKVGPDSGAAGKSIKTGDVIVQIKGATVKTPDEVVAKLNALRQAGRKNVLLLISDKKGENLRYVAVRLSGVPVGPTAGDAGKFDDLKDDLKKLD